MQGPQKPIEIFCSYAHEDESWRQQLDTHLSLMHRQGLVSTWHDRQITAGTEWAQTIDTHLNSASVILLLISPDFLASDYCYGIEMTRALEQHQANKARVIPILLRSVDWKGAPFAHLQALPTNTKPVTSWGNRDEAFTDVAAGIRRAINDLTSSFGSNDPVTPPPVWNIPYPRNIFFTGRKELLSHLQRQLQIGLPSAISQPQAISGLGGIGKTQMAVEYAYLYHQNYQAVLWARADSRKVLISSFMEIATLLHLLEKDAQDQMLIVQAVKVWLQTHREWLLILDNADELAIVREFLPNPLQGHLLLTTRAQALGGLARRIEVDTFTPELGALFLMRRASLIAPDASLEQAAPQDRGIAIQISRELGGLPLALDQAGAYMEETGCRLQDYQRIYQQRRTQLLKERRGLVEDHPEPVATTWSLSFAQVEEKNPAAAELLRFCTFLAPEDIAVEMITHGAPHLGPLLEPVASNSYELNQAIEVLRAYSLVQRDPNTGMLSIHRLVQVVLRDAMPTKETKLWVERTVCAVSATFPKVEFAQWSVCEWYLPHALVCAEEIEQWNITLLDAGSLLHRVGSYLSNRARYSEAEYLYVRALEICEQQSGPQYPFIATCLNNLAVLYYDQEKYELAEPLYVRALAIKEQQLGPEHPSTAISLNNLAGIYQAQSKYELAEPLYVRALAIKEQQLGPEHPSTAQSLNDLAGLHRAQSKYELAEPLYQRALGIREKLLGPEHPYTAQSLNNLAEFYQAQSKYELAEPLYVRALAIKEQQLELEHPHTQKVRQNYVSLLRAMGRNKKAKQIEEKQ